MFEITPEIEIDAPPETVWDYLVDVEEWWVDSNPEHSSLEIVSDDEDLKEGTRIRVREKIAGIPGEAEGEVTEFVPNDHFTWEADAVYRYLGLTFSATEGVKWSVKSEEKTELSAHVWAEFPDTLFGKVLEWYFKNVLNGVEKDYEHAMEELVYIKEQIEKT